MKKILTIGAIMLMGLSLTACGSSNSSSSGSSSSKQTTSSTSSSAAASSSSEAQVPTEFKTALIKAESYSKTMHMSKQGIYNQLTSQYGEKYSAEAAQYAVDNLKADYNANALEKAKSYQKNMAMSPEAIRQQLTSANGEKFTPEEADYAIQHLGQ
ncbi:MAG: Ltp family lipoprotein [Lactobacillus sp.]|nr:Ltp family lipoprotein [Lactobacillus sp.]